MDDLRTIKEDLAIFWGTFGGRKNKGIGFSHKKKLDWLILYAEKRYGFKNR